MYKYSNARSALIASVLMATTAAVQASPYSRPGRFIRERDPEPEAMSTAHEDQDYMAVVKQQRNQVQTKKHKKNPFHIPTKSVPMGKLAGFLERVTDPDKEQRTAEFVKNPFRNFPGRR